MDVSFVIWAMLRRLRKIEESVWLVSWNTGEAPPRERGRVESVAGVGIVTPEGFLTGGRVLIAVSGQGDPSISSICDVFLRTLPKL